MDHHAHKYAVADTHGLYHRHPYTDGNMDTFDHAVADFHTFDHANLVPDSATDCVGG
jgi:hypothetical protein